MSKNVWLFEKFEDKVVGCLKVIVRELKLIYGRDEKGRWSIQSDKYRVIKSQLKVSRKL